MVYSLVSLITCSVNLLWYVNLLFIYCILLDNTGYFIVIVIVNNKLAASHYVRQWCQITCLKIFIRNCLKYRIDELVQERRNSSALAMELRFSRTNPSICLNTKSSSIYNILGHHYIDTTEYNLMYVYLLFQAKEPFCQHFRQAIHLRRSYHQSRRRWVDTILPQY